MKKFFSDVSLGDKVEKKSVIKYNRVAKRSSVGRAVTSVPLTQLERLYRQRRMLRAGLATLEPDILEMLYNGSASYQPFADLVAPIRDLPTGLIRNMVEFLINVLDCRDGDPDLEPETDEADE